MQSNYFIQPIALRRSLSFRTWIADRQGVTAIEYAMIGGLIAAVIAASVSALGTHLNALYNSVLL